MSKLLDKIDTLLGAILNDEDRHGGLLSRQTLRHADELRVLIAIERRRQGLPEPEQPSVPRQPRGAL